MSSGDFSFSFSLPAKPPAPISAARYIARPFEAKPVGDETLILAAGAEYSVRAPLFYARMLAHCGRFATLDQHAEAVVDDFGLPAEQRVAVRQGLAGLVERKLLQDEQAVFAGLGAHETAADARTGPLRSLCVRTCNRPEDLQSLLRSLDRQIDGSGLDRVLILDDASDPAAVAATASIVAEARVNRAVQLIHIDRAMRARLIGRISTEAEVDPEALHWLIEGDVEDPAPGYGTNLNLALLLTAGERFLMIDDDATLDPFQLATPGTGLSLRVAHDFEVRFPDPDRPEHEQYPSAAINPLAAHERVLGAPVAALARDHGLQDGHLLAGLSPQMIHDFSARPRVRLTTNGTLGDAGTGSMLWQYTLPAEALADWCESEDAYRRLAFSRRVARSTLETQIASSVSLMTTTLTGVDNRELLLPVSARGRGEDLIFGIGIRFLYPGTPCCALPWMLPHRLRSPRRWQAEDLHKRQGTGLTGFIGSAIEDLAAARLPQAPFARAAVLGAWLQGLAAMEPSELTEQLRRHLLEKRTDMASGVRETLAGLARQQAPDWLQQELAGIIERHCRIEPDDSQRLAEQVPAIRQFANRYGQALPAWVQAWRWAAGLDVLEAAR
ncbi:MAG: glycosyltransferase family 2 protein [Wenzhouxiangella sp.]